MAAPADTVRRTPSRDRRAGRLSCGRVPGFMHLGVTQSWFSPPNIAVVTACMGSSHGACRLQSCISAAWDCELC